MPALGLPALPDCARGGRMSASGAIQRAGEKRRMSAALKGKRKPGGNGSYYSQIVHAHFQSPQYAKLSPRAVKLLVDLLSQYRGVNNGDLTTAWSIMKAAGWRSKYCLSLAQKELQARGWILLTRQGSLHAATLWALTLYGIDDCRTLTGKSKFDGVRPDPKPLHLWRMPQYDTPLVLSKRRVKKKEYSPIHGEALPDSRESKAPFLAVVSR